MASMSAYNRALRIACSPQSALNPMTGNVAPFPRVSSPCHGFAVALTGAMLVSACRSDSVTARPVETVKRPSAARIGAAEGAEAAEPTGA
jgi:hypothetical protein